MKNTKYIAFFSILFLTAWLLPQIIHSFELVNQVKAINSPKTLAGAQTEKEIVLIYFGCSSCGPSNSKSLPPAISIIRDTLKSKAAQMRITLKSIGISKDKLFEYELKHLAKYGPFNEIIIGNNWENTGIIRYVQNKFPGPMVTPQVIISKRTFNSINNGIRTYYGGLKNEEIVLRKVGTGNIIEFAENGVQLPNNIFK